MISYFAQTTYNLSSTQSKVAGVSLIAFLIIVALVVVLAVISMWKIFTKAGEPGWKAIIPIYNTYTLLKISGQSGWWLLIALVPYVGGLVLGIIIAYNLAKSFGYGIGMTLLEIILIGYLILAFGSAKYIGPGGAAGTQQSHIPDAPYPKVPPATPKA